MDIYKADANNRKAVVIRIMRGADQSTVPHDLGPEDLEAQAAAALPMPASPFLFFLSRGGSKMRDKCPYFPFYSYDFMSDNRIRGCTLEEQGLYVNLLYIMNQSVERGRLSPVHLHTNYFASAVTSFR